MPPVNKPTLLINYGLREQKNSRAPLNKVPRTERTQGPYMGTFTEMDRLRVHIWTFHQKYMVHEIHVDFLQEISGP